MTKKEKWTLILTDHSKVGLLVILSNAVWWIISVKLVSVNFKLFFGLLTLILTLITSYTASNRYRSEPQRQFIKSFTLNLLWMIPLTILVENCFFDFQNPQRLILSFIFGSFASVALLADIFTQIGLYKTLFQVRDSYDKKLWSFEMAISAGFTGNILQVMALYALIRYPFLNQFSWQNYSDQYYFLVNAWHLTVSITLINLPVYSLYNLEKIGQNFVNFYLRSTVLLSVLFCVACVHLRVKWFY